MISSKHYQATFVMMLMILRKIIWLVALFPLLTFSQQADAVLSKFFATPLDETVFLRWTITAGNTCEDTHIERSSDGISYERVGLIGGICGSPDQSITYEFTDTLPLFNRTAYYRLKLGYYGYSSPQTVKINRFNESGYLVAPNPFSSITRLTFENGSGGDFMLTISDMQGRVVEEMTTEGDEFIIQRLDLSSGLYFFQIRSAGNLLYSGKIMVSD